MTELELRESLIDACQRMNLLGINQGSSGNISVRCGEQMLISPSAIPYDQLEPRMIASMPIEGAYGAWQGSHRPSTEWRFHLDIMRARPEVSAIVHSHPTFATVLAIAHRDIEACHYMIAAFGGDNIRCAPYAVFGSEELSALAVDALRDRMGCLLANHGMVVLGETLDKAMWRAVELETIARQYYYALLLGSPNILSAADIDATLSKFNSYGMIENAERARGAGKVGG